MINLELMNDEARESFVKSYVRKDIAFQLKIYRELNKLTKKELADMINVSESDINELESSNSIQNLELVVKVASKLGYNVDVNLKKI